MPPAIVSNEERKLDSIFSFLLLHIMLWSKATSRAPMENSKYKEALEHLTWDEVPLSHYHTTSAFELNSLSRTSRHPLYEASLRNCMSFFLPSCLLLHSGDRILFLWLGTQHICWTSPASYSRKQTGYPKGSPAKLLVCLINKYICVIYTCKYTCKYIHTQRAILLPVICGQGV